MVLGPIGVVVTLNNYLTYTNNLKAKGGSTLVTSAVNNQTYYTSLPVQTQSYFESLYILVLLVPVYIFFVQYNACKFMHEVLKNGKMPQLGHEQAIATAVILGSDQDNMSAIYAVKYGSSGNDGKGRAGAVVLILVTIEIFYSLVFFSRAPTKTAGLVVKLLLNIKDIVGVLMNSWVLLKNYKWLVFENARQNVLLEAAYKFQWDKENPLIFDLLKHDWNESEMVDGGHGKMRGISILTNSI